MTDQKQPFEVVGETRLKGWKVRGNLSEPLTLYVLGSEKEAKWVAEALSHAYLSELHAYLSELEAVERGG